MLLMIHNEDKQKRRLCPNMEKYVKID